jgi:hypothetical protein
MESGSDRIAFSAFHRFSVECEVNDVTAIEVQDRMIRDPSISHRTPSFKVFPFFRLIGRERIPPSPG